MKYLLVEISGDEQNRVPKITYFGGFLQLEDAYLAKIVAQRDNPGLQFYILVVLS